jgi:hypothetical protein
MRTTRWWWGMLCLAGMACSGDGPPLGAGETREGNGRDLEFRLPAVRGEHPIFARDTADRALTVRRDVTADLTEGTSKTSDTSGPLIWTTSLSSAFNGSRYEMEYGMTGFGTGYSMRPLLDIVTFAGERIIASAGPGRSENAPIPWRFMPSVTDHVLLHTDCGMISNLLVVYEARLDIKTVPPTSEQDQRRSTAHAPQCPITSTDGGGGGGSDVTYFTITVCSYEAWYDSDGNLIDVLFLGCYSYSVGNMT